MSLLDWFRQDKKPATIITFRRDKEGVDRTLVTQRDANGKEEIDRNASATVRQRNAANEQARTDYENYRDANPGKFENKTPGQIEAWREEFVRKRTDVLLDRQSAKRSGDGDSAAPAQSAPAQQEVAKGAAGTTGTAAQGTQGSAAADKSLLPLPKVVVEERLRGEGVNTNLEEYERDSAGSNTGVAKATTSNQAFSVNRRQGQSFNIGRFRSEVSGADSVLPTHSFLVVFAPMPWAIQKFPTAAGNLDSILTMRCDNVVLPSINLLQEQNIRRYGFGPVENVPYGVNVGDFTLQFIVDKNAFVVQFFEEWLNKIVNRDSFGGANMNNVLPGGRKPYEIAYKDTYACSSINVFVYDRSQNNVMEYNIYDAFPTGIQSMNMSWSEENELMKLNITFSFTDVRIKQSPAKKKQDAPFSDEIKVTAKVPWAVNPFASGGSLAAIDPSGDFARKLADFSNETTIIGDFAGRIRGSVTPIQLNTVATSQTADVPVQKNVSTLNVRINPPA